jgi:iron complex transport system substrate-binding protein
VLTCRAKLCALAPLALFAFACSAPDETPTKRSGVVSFSPNITETVFALGQGDRLVAVSAYCDYPSEVDALPKAGDYLSPNFEKLALLAPEMILLAGKHEKVVQFAEMNGIKAVNAHMDNLATIHSGIMAVAEALGVPDRGEALYANIEAQLDAVRQSAAGKPRPNVFVVTFRTNNDLNSLSTVGKSSFLSELVEAAGGRNIFDDFDDPYFEASKETVVVRAPDVIVEFHAGEQLSETDIAAYREDWRPLDMLPAVRDGRIHIVTETYGLRPGPRVPLIAERFARWFHPESESP